MSETTPTRASRLSETTASQLRQAVDQMREVLKLIGMDDDSISKLDASDTRFCTGSVEAAAKTIEGILDADDSNGPEAAHARNVTNVPIPFTSIDSGTSPSTSSAMEVDLTAVGVGGARLGDGNAVEPLSDVPFTIDIRQPTPMTGRHSDDATSAAGGAAKQASGKDVVVDENDEEKLGVDGNVARWLNGTFADHHKRQSTGFEVRLQRSASIMSMNMKRANERDDEEQDEAQELFKQGYALLPDGTTCAATKYSRSNTRSYPAFCSDQRFVETLKRAGVERVHGINDSDFDIFPYVKKYGEDVFTVVCANVFLQYNFIRALGINLKYFMNFVRELQKHYFMRNPYHNGIHAADVLQTTNVYLCTGDVKDNFSDVELIAVLFAAMAHDVGHPGTTNLFLSKARHPLSRLYNDTSTLESMHAAMAFILLDKSECNFFEGSKVWTKAHDSDFRALAIEIILGTDMKHHASMTQSVCDILEDGQIEDDEVARLFRAIVHAADLSNPMKPLHVYVNWMERVNAEFWQQGDEERRRELDISVMCDRSSPSIFKGQVGFIEFVVRPFMQELAPVLPPIWIERLQKNLEYVKNGDEVAERRTIQRIERLSETPWIDVPMRAHSFFTVVIRYLDTYRLSSQLDFADDCDPDESRVFEIGDNETGTRGQQTATTPLTGKSDPKRTVNLARTRELHTSKLAEECEQWMHRIASYRPQAASRSPSITVPLAGTQRQHTGVLVHRGTSEFLGVDVTPANPTATNSSDVGSREAGKDKADDDFYNRFCSEWLVTILEMQMALRMQAHHALDEKRHSSSTGFVPYLDEGAAKIILECKEATTLLRRREDEERRVEEQLRRNHEEAVNARTPPSIGKGRPSPGSDVIPTQPGLPRPTKLESALQEMEVAIADEEADDDGNDDADDGDGASTSDEEASRTFSWIRKRGSSRKMSPRQSPASVVSAQSPAAQAGSFRTLYKKLKESEFIADEDILIEALRTTEDKQLAARAVEFLVEGAAPPAHAARPAALRAVRVVEPPSSPQHQAGKATRSTTAVRFVSALTKTLVVAFGNHLRRSRAPDRRRSSLASSVDMAAPDSGGATVDASSVANRNTMRDKTTRWLEEMYEREGSEGSRRASSQEVHSRTRSPVSSQAQQQRQPTHQTQQLAPVSSTSAMVSTPPDSRRPSDQRSADYSQIGTEVHPLGASPPEKVMDPPTPSLKPERVAVPRSRTSTTSAGSSPTNPPAGGGSSAQRPPRSPQSVSLPVPLPGALAGPLGHDSPDRSQRDSSATSLSALEERSTPLAGGAGSGLRGTKSDGGRSLWSGVTTPSRALQTGVVAYVNKARRLDRERLSRSWQHSLETVPERAWSSADVFDVSPSNYSLSPKPAGARLPPVTSSSSSTPQPRESPRLPTLGNQTPQPR